MRMRFAVILLLGSCLSASAAPPTAAVTVQGAIRLLSKEQTKNLVRIEAREGAPAPDRWYFQIYDPTAENGLREIVVWQKTVVAARTVSQFLDSAKPEDVVGAKFVRTDSDELIRIAQRYVEEHSLNVAKINYSMYRDDAASIPVWKLSCFDDADREVVELVINARTGAMVSHNEFDPTAAPSPAATPSVAVAPTPPPGPAAPSATPPQAVAAATASPSPVPADTAGSGPSSAPADAASASPSPSSLVEASPPTKANSTPKASPSPSKSTPTPSPTPKRGLFQRIFGGGKQTPTPTPRTH